MKKKKFLKKNSELKIADMRDQLSRAYLIIAILSVVSIVLFKIGASSLGNTDSFLMILLMIGLGLLAILSLAAAFTYTNYKK